MKDLKIDKIKCPNCGAEYLPSEIFYPNDFLGKPNHIYKTVDGEILDIDGPAQKFNEEFICDYCNKPLNICVEHSYNVTVNIAKDLDDFVTPLYGDRLILKED